MSLTSVIYAIINVMSIAVICMARTFEISDHHAVLGRVWAPTARTEISKVSLSRSQSSSVKLRDGGRLQPMLY